MHHAIDPVRLHVVNPVSAKRRLQACVHRLKEQVAAERTDERDTTCICNEGNEHPLYFMI